MDTRQDPSSRRAVPRFRAIMLRQSDVGVLAVRCVVTPEPLHDVDDAKLVLVSRDGHGESVHPLGRGLANEKTVLEGRVRLWTGERPLLGPGDWDLCISFGGTDARVPLLAPPYGKADWPTIMVPASAGPQMVAVFAMRAALGLNVSATRPYVEVERVEVNGAKLTVDGYVVPDAELGDSAGQLLVRSREDADAEVILPVEVIEGRLRAVVNLGALPGEDTRFWDFFLRDGDGRELRLGGHLDDIRNKREVFSFPSHVLERSGRRLALQPFYTKGNDFSVRALPVHTGSVSHDAAVRPEPSPPRSRGRFTRAVTGSLVWGAERLGRLRRPRSGGGRPRVYFLIHHVYGIGGVHRVVLNLARHLADDHDVEIISIFRSRSRPSYEVDPRVKVTFLLDEMAICGLSPRGPRQRLVHLLRRLLGQHASWIVPEEDPAFARHSLWLDLKLVRRLHLLRPGVLIGTRVYLNVFAARFARPGVVTIGQEHLNFVHREPLVPTMRDHYRKLDALAVLTRGDEEDFRDLLNGATTRVVRIPNALAEKPMVRADRDSKRVVAVSHYNSKKGLDLLVSAFAQVVRKHPDWQLRIFGGGPLRESLQRQARELGLHNHVYLMGRTNHVFEELGGSSIFVLSSRAEGFAMVIIEAMAVGLPVVSFDCPRGPSDIITDDVDGMLVPPEDVDSLAAAINGLIEDPDRRRSYGEAALRTARSYEIDVVGKVWRRTFDELLGRS